MRVKGSFALKHLRNSRKISVYVVARLLLQFLAVNQRKRVQGLCAVAELTMAVAIIALLRTIGR